MPVVHGLGAPSVHVQRNAFSSAIPVRSPDITKGAESDVLQHLVTLHANVRHLLINISKSLPVISWMTFRFSICGAFRMCGLSLLEICHKFLPPRRTLHTFISWERREPHCIWVSLFAGRNGLNSVTRFWCIVLPKIRYTLFYFLCTIPERKDPEYHSQIGSELTASLMKPETAVYSTQWTDVLFRCWGLWHINDVNSEIKQPVLFAIGYSRLGA
jgi:hypothetical protein